VLLVSGCSQFAGAGLAFRDDPVVRITTPTHRARVRAPFTLRWRALRPLPRGGRYEILVDRAPQPPGARPDRLAHGDDACRHTPGCPDATWYAAHGVFLTRGTLFDVPFVAPIRDERSSTLHDATIVVLDGTGRRVGEAGAFLEFHLVAEPNGIIESG